MFKKFNKSSGAVSSILLVLGVVLLVVIIIVFIVIKISASKTAAPPTSAASATSNTAAQAPAPPAPVYQTQLGDVDFTVEAATDLGSVLTDASNTSHIQSVTTTEKFVEVIVGAQNNGKLNTNQGIWDIGNIVDSDGRNFVPDNNANFYVPKSSQCGSMMEPAFALVPCIKIYEVSNESTGLTVEVHVTSPKNQEAFLDLNVQ